MYEFDKIQLEELNKSIITQKEKLQDHKLCMELIQIQIQLNTNERDNFFNEYDTTKSC